jgi:hypothetical protein
MSTTTQYIGERYVPIVADPVEWNANREYEHLTIVMYNGDSYISKQDVPKGAQITNTRYWLKTSSFNAQIDQAIRQASSAIQKADEALAKFPVSIANGGTGKTTATEAWTALGGGSIGKKNALSASDIPSGIDVSKITGTLDVAHGGTGVTTAQAERNRLGLGNTTNALPVANGGTDEKSNLLCTNIITNEEAEDRITFWIDDCCYQVKRIPETSNYHIVQIE